MRPKLFTIGVYGFDENAFFKALIKSQIDTFCDIRARRGMRGSQYSFVNSKYLQARLKDFGIHYYHVKNLAPSENIRSVQREHDKKANIEKRGRTLLSNEFITAYQNQVLTGFSVDNFLLNFDPIPQALVLFCVERYPEACHRSIVAQEIAAQLHATVEDILP